MAGDINLFEYLDREVKDISSLYIVLHRRADLDSYISGYVIWKYIRKFHPDLIEIYFVFPDGISQNMSELLNPTLLDVPSIENPKPSGDSMVLFVDVGGPGVLADYINLLEGDGIKVLIDHHTISTVFTNKFDAVFVNSDASSTIEIILDNLSRRVGVEAVLDKDEVDAVIMALLAETRFLQLAKWSTLRLLSMVLEKYHPDTRLSHFMSRMRKDMDISEKLAVLKGVQRIILYRSDSNILAVTNIGAFHSTVSSKLISCGADVAIVYSTDEVCKVHIRVSDQLYEKTGVDVVKDIIIPIKEKFGGTGGGHAQIGSIELPDERCSIKLNEILLTILELLKDRGLEFKRI